MKRKRRASASTSAAAAAAGTSNTTTTPLATETRATASTVTAKTKTTTTKPAAKRKVTSTKSKSTSAVASAPSSPSSPSSAKTASSSSPKKKPKKKPTTTAKTKTKIAARTAPPPQVPARPANILIVDNGGDTIKYGWNHNNNTSNTPNEEGGVGEPALHVRHLPNRTARLQQQWTVLVGDELSKITNPSQLVGVTSSTERGVITNLGNQIQVWKRMLDLLHVQIPLHTETAHAFGWSTQATTAAKKKKQKKARTTKKKKTTTNNDDDHNDDAGDMKNRKIILPGACAVLLTLPPFCPRVVMDAIATVWFDDFGFGFVGFCTSPVVCAFSRNRHPDYQTCLVVDIGWSAIHICPTYYHNNGKQPVIVSSNNAIRRIPYGGRHLINIWKYWTSYRQYNLMDQEYILRDVLERTAYVSLDFDREMMLARTVGGGRRPYDREYVLPDYQNTFEGRIRLPAALQQQQQADEEEEEEEQEESEDDEDVDEEEMMKEAEAAERRAEEGGESDSAGSDGDDDEEEDEESAEQIRRRVLNRRAAEERRTREMEQGQQVLNVSTERFVIPETLFRPADVGLPSDWVGLPTAIVQSIEACPKALQPAMYQSIHLVGGLSQLPGLKERLEYELRTLAPCEYDVKIITPPSSSSSDEPESSSSSSPIDQAWYGACQFSKTVPYEKWCISKLEWESNKNNKRGGASLWKRFEASSSQGGDGGHLI